MDSSFVFKSFGMLFDLFGGRNLEYVEKCPWLTHSLSPALTPTLRCKCQIPVIRTCTGRSTIEHRREVGAENWPELFLCATR